MTTALGLLTIVAVICAGSALATRLRMSAPLLLVVIGVVGSYLPFLPPVRLIPELVLIGILPPLLYAAALRSSVAQFRTLKRPIAMLSVGYVIFGTVTIGFLVWWLIPEVPLPAAFALGAVIAPPDAVAATSIARRVGMPRRAVALLEGESLVNDATALVLLRSSVAALAGSITLFEVAVELVVAAAGGAVIGIAAGTALLYIRKRVRNVAINTAMALAAPFVAFLPAEALHTSGVLAVVVAGLIIGTRTPTMPGGASRLSQRTNWATVQFLLENAVFLLIGLQVRSIVDAAAMDPLGPVRVWTTCGIVLVAVIVLRPVWIFPGSYLPRLLPTVRKSEPPLPWQFPAVVSWAGMRGVVTLAAVFVLPETVPHRPVLVLIALVVAAGTLAVQGFSLPWVVRRLRLRGPDRREDALQRALLLRRATAAGLEELEGQTVGSDPPALVAALRRRTEEWNTAAWERLGPPERQSQTPSQRYFQLRTEMLEAERKEVLKLRRGGLYDPEVVDEVLERLDAEEAMLEVFLAVEDEQSAMPSPVAGESSAPPGVMAGRCAHLLSAPERSAPADPQCLGCLVEGTTPVHLRMCLECGAVGCCESSEGLHADRHFRDTGHLLMRSVEPGESWRWCYRDEVLG
jgi:CPA1 family monovalent cation:H+ antiporter